MPRHRALLAGSLASRPSRACRPNGTSSCGPCAVDSRTLLQSLGVSGRARRRQGGPGVHVRGARGGVRAFLQGLFDADGCVVDQAAKGTRYVGLGSRSEELLLGVQELLASARDRRPHLPDRHQGGLVPLHPQGRHRGRLRQRRAELRPADQRALTCAAFAERVGFSTRTRPRELGCRAGASDSFYQVDETTVSLISRCRRGFETTYNLTEPRNHSYIVSGVVVANCSEYMHLDNSSCNLASLNLLTFLGEDGTFDAAAFPEGRRAGHHRDGHLHLLRRLPDRADRRDHPRVPPARASATPTSARC